MNIAVTRISCRGHVLIPRNIRKKAPLCDAEATSLSLEDDLIALRERTRAYEARDLTVQPVAPIRRWRTSCRSRWISCRQPSPKERPGYNSIPRRPAPFHRHTTMTRISKRALRATAEHARKDLESGDADRTLLANLYAAYNRIPDVHRFVCKALDQFPTLACGIASAYVRYRLGRGRIVQGRFAGHPHTFVLVDKTIVDITSDQYGGPRVYVGPLRRPWLLGPATEDATMQQHHTAHTS
jgi:hypothetical protein